MADRADCQFGDRSTSPWFDAGMRGELARGRDDAADPLGYGASILPRRQGPVRISAAWEQVLASFAIVHAKVVVEGLSRRLR